MFIENIYLLNFKNYEEIALTFSEDINCIVGPNGIGKTNLLDAIYYLCMTKSAFNSIETLNITHEEYFFLNKGTFITSENGTANATAIQCAYKKGEKKSIKLDKKEYEKLRNHIGKFPCVLMTPYDTDLVRESSEIRRKFFDNTLSQTNSEYLENLMQYNHFLKQRNNLLKLFAERKTSDTALLETYNAQMTPLAREIYQTRSEFIKDFIPYFLSYYKQLSSAKEDMSIKYASQLENGDFEVLLKQNLHKDLLAQRTTEGIHKDDYIFEMDGFSLKKMGSQGQQKSYVVALKLAQYAWIAEQKQVKPILLLDDIFDKLDDHRIGKLLEMMASDNFGQIFISDASPERSETLLRNLKREVKFVPLSEILNK